MEEHAATKVEIYCNFFALVVCNLLLEYDIMEALPDCVFTGIQYKL